ncbi:hypothetical protein ES703_80307 [subsurface metagenome]
MVFGIDGLFQPVGIIIVVGSDIAVGVVDLIEQTACVIGIVRIAAIGVVDIGKTAECIIEVLGYKVVRLDSSRVRVNFSDSLFEVAAGIIGIKGYHIVGIV